MSLIYNLKSFSVNGCQSVSRDIPWPYIFKVSSVYCPSLQQLHPHCALIITTVSNEISRFLLLSHWLPAISLVHLAIFFLCLNRGGFTLGYLAQISIFLSCQEILKNIPSTTDGPCDCTTSAHHQFKGRDAASDFYVIYNYLGRHMI